MIGPADFWTLVVLLPYQIIRIPNRRDSFGDVGFIPINYIKLCPLDHLRLRVFYDVFEIPLYYFGGDTMLMSLSVEPSTSLYCSLIWG